jgi:hypothetical protein
MDESRRRESLVVRRRGYRWGLVAAYLSMLFILTVTMSGITFDSGITKIAAWRKIK